MTGIRIAKATKTKKARAEPEDFDPGHREHLKRIGMGLAAAGGATIAVTLGLLDPVSIARLWQQNPREAAAKVAGAQLAAAGITGQGYQFPGLDSDPSGIEGGFQYYNSATGQMHYQDGAANANRTLNAWKDCTGAPFVTVSPVGTAQGYPENNGANFGPDTAGTTTSGIQEAATSLTNAGGVVRFSSGVYAVTTTVQYTSDQPLRFEGQRSRSSEGVADITVGGTILDISAIPASDWGFIVGAVTTNMGLVEFAGMSIRGRPLSYVGTVGGSMNGMSTDVAHQVPSQVTIDNVEFLLMNQAMNINTQGNGPCVYSHVQTTYCGQATGGPTAYLTSGSTKIVSWEDFNSQGSYTFEFGGSRVEIENLTAFTQVTGNIIQLDDGVSVFEMGNFVGWGPSLFGIQNSTKEMDVSIGRLYTAGSANGTAAGGAVLQLQSGVAAVRFHVEDFRAVNGMNYIFYSGGHAAAAGSYFSIGDFYCETLNTAYVDSTTVPLTIERVHPTPGLSITSPAVPATGTAYTNAFPFRIRLYFLTASGVTYTITDPAGNVSSAITGAVGSEVTLDPGAKITPTYSTLTWQAYGT